MADSNMDFENKADLLDEDSPPILSSGVREVFYLFASMLDIKSFMKLAMTSKTMYKQCMEDKMIRIQLEEKEVSVNVECGVRIFSFHSVDIPDKHIEKYLEKLRQLKCSVSLKKISFQGCDVDVNQPIIMETRRYLDELGVKTIERLFLYKYVVLNLISFIKVVLNPISFIKDYNLKDVDIDPKLPDDVVRELLQLKLDSFTYDGSMQGEMLLQVDSPIPQLELSMQLSADVLTQILWKIQTGALKKLAIRSGSFPWNSFVTIRSDHDGPLPNERPLLITYDNYLKENWFLHWDGAVTKCEDYYPCKFSKCEQDDLPPVLRSKEMVHKALAEKHTKIYCFKSHFTSFFDGIPVLHASYEGPFPEERPLLCRKTNNDENYEANYLLNADGSMDAYYWSEYAYHGGTYYKDGQWFIDGHLPLQKYILKKGIEKRVDKGSFGCSNGKEFRLLFEDYEPLPHDFRGQLPKRRPLVFARKGFRVVLHEDGTLVQYRFEKEDQGYIEPCPTRNVPSVLITPENLKKIVLDTPDKKFTYSIGHSMFRDAFLEIKTLPFHTSDDLPKERPLIFKKTRLLNGKFSDQRWVLLKERNVRKCVWIDGKATFSRADPLEFPFMLTKTLVTQCFEGKELDTTSFFCIDRYALNQCLEDYKIFDYDGVYSSADDRPLIFKKTEVRHTCQEIPGDCDCMEEILHFCVVNDIQQVVHITWEDRFLSFNEFPNPDDLPSALKTKEMLEYVLEKYWIPDLEREARWYGSYEDLIGYFEEHEMIDFDHIGPLPNTRPLFFKDDSPIRQGLDVSPVYWFLRKDGVLIKCEKKNSYATLTINPKNGRPPAISCSS